MAITPEQYAIGSGVGSIITGIGGAYAKSQSYKVQKYQAETRAKIAKMQGKADALQLQRQFNQTMASNTVMAAAQGRRGGSVEQIGMAAEQQFNWDADFTKLSAQIEESGYRAQASQYGMAAGTALMGGAAGAISGGLQDIGTSLYQIGDKKEG